MLDWRRGLHAAEIVAVAVVIVGNGAGTRCHEGEGGYQTEGSGQTHEHMPPVAYWKNVMGEARCCDGYGERRADPSRAVSQRDEGNMTSC